MDVFLWPTGTEIKKVHELMQTTAMHNGISLPTPTAHRKVIASEVNEHLKLEEVTLLQTHMSHSRQTAERYYQKPMLTAAVKSHKNIEKLIQQRGGFPTDDGKILKEWLITEESMPSLLLCKFIIILIRQHHKFRTGGSI